MGQSDIGPVEWKGCRPIVLGQANQGWCRLIRTWGKEKVGGVWLASPSLDQGERIQSGGPAGGRGHGRLVSSRPGLGDSFFQLT